MADINQFVELWLEDDQYCIYHIINNKHFDCYFKLKCTEAKALEKFQDICETVDWAVDKWNEVLW